MFQNLQKKSKNLSLTKNAFLFKGTLEDGTKFDSSVDRNEPFKFQIGVGQVIKGWEEGVLGMCVGEKRRLLVPSELVPEIMNKIKLVNDDGEIISGGAGATLFFDIELLEIEDSPAPVNVIVGRRYL